MDKVDIDGLVYVLTLGENPIAHPLRKGKLSERRDRDISTMLFEVPSTGSQRQTTPFASLPSVMIL